MYKYWIDYLRTMTSYLFRGFPLQTITVIRLFCDHLNEQSPIGKTFCLYGHSICTWASGKRNQEGSSTFAFDV